MPTFAVVFYLIVLFSTDLWGGYAKSYDVKMDLYGSDSCSFLSQKIGVNHVFSDLSFRFFSVGGAFFDGAREYLVLDFGYGRYWRFRPNSKLITMVSFEPGYYRRSDLFFKSFCHLGIMRRVSSRFSVQVLTGIPLVSIHQKSSFILSLGLNYFYGSGIAYRETSEKLKKVKKKFLWFLWFYD